MIRVLSSSINARSAIICIVLFFLHSIVGFSGILLSPVLRPQSTGALRGTVTDSDSAVVPGASVLVVDREIGVERFAQTDDEGNYQVAALPIGTYRIEVQAQGFQTQIVEQEIVEVGRTMVHDFRLPVGNISQEVAVTAGPQLVERSSLAVGNVVNGRLVQEVPLNGRYFLDLGLLVPGSVTPPQNGFSTAPVRGSGSFAINTAGNREESVNYLVNGITLNSQSFNSINFQPSISSVQEFKVDNSTFSAEYGQSSGAVVNIATRSGTNGFHGELFEFLRNDALDARNFFEFMSSQPPPFKRNLFGGNLGGPIARNKTFFFFSYEALRQRQELSLNSLVLSDSERASVSDLAMSKLIRLIPPSNFVDSSGTARFIGSANAPVNVDNWTADLSHNLSARDRLHGYFALQFRSFLEPSRDGNTIPGFGNKHHSNRPLLTLNETHTFGSSLVNEARVGFNRLYGNTTPRAQLNPADYGILNGINQPVGLPQMSVAGGLNFGGPSTLPAGRGDTTIVFADTVSCLCGSHSLKFGGEFRQFLSNIFRSPTGSFNFPTVADFLTGTANSFSVTLGDQSSSVAQGALGFFVQDSFRLRPRLTMDVGLRYDWNITPTERYNRLIVFDPDTVSLRRAGTNVNEIYRQDNKNFQPRLGLAWDPFGDGKTLVRSAYGIFAEQPLGSMITPLTANPPLAMPFTFSGPIRLDSALTVAQAAGLAPQTVDHDFRNTYMQSWNLNVQRELRSGLAAMAGYFGSKGTHLILRRNLNQLVNGVRPFAALSPSSPILPGTALNNITQVESTGNSIYNALWVSAKQRLSHGLQFDASYTLSKSLDYNSLSSQGIVMQDSYNLRGNRGLSDFDVRHRLVTTAVYELPLGGNQYAEGWQFAVIVQAQGGNPVNIVTSNGTVNGTTNTIRPDVTGPIRIIGDVDHWFDTTVFKPAAIFGNLGRNVVTGPGFFNTDFSIIKNTRLKERMRMQFRAEFFDLFNHANLGQPGNIIDTPSFGRITNTRFPTGESGSSRQVQFAMKLVF